jgi:hypothetical protein
VIPEDAVKTAAKDLYRLEWDADLYATPRGTDTERYEERAKRLLAAGCRKVGWCSCNPIVGDEA